MECRSACRLRHGPMKMCFATKSPPPMPNRCRRCNSRKRRGSSRAPHPLRRLLESPGVDLLAHRGSRVSDLLHDVHQACDGNVEMLGPEFYLFGMVEVDLAAIGAASADHVATIRCRCGNACLVKAAR